ncbi:MAG: twin-arginine translocase TatA/TatE family subunit [Deltaproteobacteria bacterium]|nr:twin-arginine translocase TatA/TatE family subunit [Deltaproteobacteria bacterium]
MPELVIILIIILIIFGTGKLPEIGGAMGKGIRNFRKASHDKPDEIDVTPEADDKSATSGQDKTSNSGE